MMRAALFWMAVLAAVPALGGCAAAGNLSAKGGPRVYGGTEVDLALLRGDLGPDADPNEVKKIERPVLAWAACGGMVDLPFSFVADTVMLPVTVPLAFARGRNESQGSEEPLKEVDGEYEMNNEEPTTENRE